MGGQVGDIGTITINGKAANVVNTTKTEDGYYLHETEVQLTPIKVGDTVYKCLLTRFTEQTFAVTILQLIFFDKALVM